jgi:hypothetical protein
MQFIKGMISKLFKKDEDHLFYNDLSLFPELVSLNFLVKEKFSNM